MTKKNSSTVRSRLSRLRRLTAYALYRMRVQPSARAVARHYRLVQELDAEEAFARQTIVLNVVAAPEAHEWSCAECGEGDGRSLTTENFSEVCHLCRRMREEDTHARAS